MTEDTYTDMTIGRLPDGGFVVFDSSARMITGSCKMLFAATEIEEALAYIQEKLTEKGRE